MSSGDLQVDGKPVNGAATRIGAPAIGAMSLAGITMLQRLSPEERSALEAQCLFRRVGTGEVVLDRFTSSDAVYFVVCGTARVVHYVDQQEITIATIAAGDTIGEISAIDGLGRSATVLAEEDCAIAELPREQFQALIVRRGDIALELLQRWAATIRKLSEKVSHLSIGSPDQRVYAELVRLARAEKPGSERWVIRELPSHQELAQWAQTSREVVAGALGLLLRRGIVERRTKTLHINDYRALTDLVTQTAA